MRHGLTYDSRNIYQIHICIRFGYNTKTRSTKDMNKLPKIPLIFGVTGHRDLRPEDREKHIKAIKNIFTKYNNEYPNTPLILISALADGADMLVASVACEMDIELHVLIPYNQGDYLNSIDDKELFHELSQKAGDEVKVLECEQNEDGKFTHCYQQLGEQIADSSNILIALWDGVEEPSNNGGTAAIVRYQRDGFDENMFDSRDGDVIHIIPTARVSKPNQDLDPLQKNVEYLGRLKRVGFKANLQRLDALNEDISTHTCKDQSSDYTLLQKYKKFFGDRANTNQTRYKSLMTWLIMLIGIAIIFLETMHILSGAGELYAWGNHLILGYFAGLSAAYYIYRYKMRGDKLQNDFIYSRGFSEAIRVQSAWNDSSIGLEKKVSSYYLRAEPNSLAWMRIALKNIAYMDSSSYQSAADWIEEQTAYFEKNITKRDEDYEHYETIEKWVFCIGVVGVGITALLYLAELAHIIPHGDFPSNWHLGVLLSGIALLLAAFFKKYLYIHGFKEERDNFREILSSFEQADKRFKGADKKLKQQIVFDLGKKALIENSQWVSLHNQRRARFEME